jgi:hypothetical protein
MTVSEGSGLLAVEELQHPSLQAPVIALSTTSFHTQHCTFPMFVSFNAQKATISLESTKSNILLLHEPGYVMPCVDTFFGEQILCVPGHHN